MWLQMVVTDEEDGILNYGQINLSAAGVWCKCGEAEMSEMRDTINAGA